MIDDWWVWTSWLVIDESNQQTGDWWVEPADWLVIDESNWLTGDRWGEPGHWLPLNPKGTWCNAELFLSLPAAKASALRRVHSHVPFPWVHLQDQGARKKLWVEKLKSQRARETEKSMKAVGNKKEVDKEREREEVEKGKKRKFICSAAVQHFTSWAFCGGGGGGGGEGVCKSCQQRHGHYARISGHLILILSFSVEPPSSLPQGKTLTTLFTKTGTVNSIDMQCLIINVCGYQDAHAWSGMSVETSWCECLILVILQHSELCNL